MTHDKENATPPPNLVPMDNEKKRKSSVKRVRFSLDKEPSPLRLNNDILASDDVPIRISVAGRRSSISDSPLSFPTQDDLLRSGQSDLSHPSVPSGSPGADSRQSTGSSVNVLSTALNSFSNVSSILQPEGRQRSIWDTPSSSAGPKSRPMAGPVSTVPLNLNSPKRSSNNSSETPGDERKLFGFNVLTDGIDDSNRTFARSSVGGEDSNAPVVVVVNTGDVSPVRRKKSISAENHDDPMLLTGASSVVQPRVPMSAASSFGTDLVTPGSAPSAASSKSGGRRRRRRLSSLEEIESELKNLGTPSPDRRKAPTVGNLQELLNSEGIDIEKLANDKWVSRPQSKASSPRQSVFEKLSSEAVLGISLQQMQSISVSLDEMTEILKQRIEQSRADLRKLLTDEKVQTALKSPADSTVLELSAKEAELVGKQMELQLLEAQHKNLLQSFAHFDRYGSLLERQSEEVAQIRTDCESLTASIAEFRKQFDAELEAKYVLLPSGGFERRRSEAELRLKQLDSIIASHENDIRETISEITEIEQEIAAKQAVHVAGFNSMRAFYLKHGWNVVAEIQGSIVIVYSGCHLLVFEKARNNDMYWCLDRIIPCKFDTGKLPFYTQNLLNSQITFYPGIVLQQLAASSQLVRPFRYTPQSLSLIMEKATTALCELIEVREALSRILTSPDSRVKINSNLQIEAVLVVVNTALGIDVPLMVKLLWFDPIFADRSVRYSNFSFIVTDSLLRFFPAVKTQIEERFAKIQGDPLSIKMLEDIVKAVHSVLIHAKPQLHH